MCSEGNLQFGALLNVVNDFHGNAVVHVGRSVVGRVNGVGVTLFRCQPTLLSNKILSYHLNIISL